MYIYIDMYTSIYMCVYICKDDLDGEGDSGSLGREVTLRGRERLLWARARRRLPEQVKIFCFICLDLYHKSRNLGVRQYKTKQTKI